MTTFLRYSLAVLGLLSFMALRPQALKAQNDVGIVGIVSPAGLAICGSPASISVEITNAGSVPLTTAALTTLVDGGGSPTGQLWTGNLAPGASTVVVLSSLALPPGFFFFSIVASTPNGLTDDNPDNDVFTGILFNGEAQGAPFFEDFGMGGIFPNGTNMDDFDVDFDGFEWAISNSASAYGQGTGAALFDNFSGDANSNPGGTVDFLFLPAINLPASGLPVLRFDYAYAPYADGPNQSFDSLAVIISTNCVESFEEVPLFYAGGADLATAPAVAVGFLPTATQWDSVVIDLSAYAGQQVVLAFVNISDWGNLIWLDNISVEIQSSPPPPCSISVSVSAEGPSCDGNSDGSAYVNVSNANGPYTVLWSTNASTDTITGLPSGAYSVTVAESPTCTASANFSLAEPAPLSLLLAPQGESALGANNGSIAANVGGGTPPYTYAWSNGSDAAGLSAIAPGSYGLTVTDANGCSISDQAVVQAFVCGNLLASINISATPPCGQSTGFALVALQQGGTAPYTYAWSNGGNGPSLSNLAPGQYSLTVTDVNGCTASAQTELLAFGTPSVSLSTQTSACSGGSAAALASGGMAPYTYVWSNGSTAPSLGNLAPGQYGVTVTDANGCTASAQTELLSISGLGVSLSTESSLCGGSNASALVSGGTAPFTYAWNNGGTGPNLSNLAPGQYSVTVTDVNGCTAVAQTELSASGNLSASLSTQNGVCGGGGTAIVLVSGGTAPFSYAWNNGSNGLGLNNLAPGQYSVTITDANGCTASAAGSVVLLSQGVDFTLMANDVDCHGDSNGSAQVVVTQGATPVSFEWSTGSTESSLSELAAGSYTVTITDANGCIAATTVQIAEPTPLSILLTGSPAGSGTNGSLLANVSGGIPPYVYAWSNGGSSGPLNNNLGAGTYTITVTDANGCVAINSATVGFTSSTDDLPGLERLSLSPNPTPGLAFLDLAFGEWTSLQISLHDMQGRALFSQALWLKDERVPIDLSALPAGPYVLHLRSGQGHMAKPLIKY